MRRVRLEKLCETKNAQAERSGRRMASKRLRSGRADVLAGLFGFGVLRQNFRGSIEHVVSIRPGRCGDFTASRDAMSGHSDPRIINIAQGLFRRPIPDHVEDKLFGTLRERSVMFP